MTDKLLQLTNIDKAFFGIRVLKQVSLQLHAGRTLGLVGENGAGKSTLMNILGGNLFADAGQMSLDGQIYVPRSPREAEQAGVAFIHQELNLFPNLSIAENLFLTHFPRKICWIDRHASLRRATDLLGQVGLDLSANLRVESLSAGVKQLVESAKALNLDARLIILDEPTTSLTARETDRLFQLLESLRSQGIAMIYISHALGEVQQLCDEIVVLRDGQVVGDGPIAEFDTNQMVTLMVGREVDQQFPPRSSQPTGEVLLSARGLSQPGVLHDISFSLHRGEVLGVSGLMGSGRTELARILFGLDPVSAGELELGGRSIIGLPTRLRIGHGMAMLTESRREDGLCMQSSIGDNISLVSAKRYAQRPFGVLRLREIQSAIGKMRRSVKLTKTADNRQPVRTLSGGNQQKVVLAKWLLNQPKVLILDEPTRGIDVGAKYEIYGLIDQLAASGAAVLVISSEIDELLGICDSMLVMSQGEIKDRLTREEFDPKRIMRAALRSGGAA